MNHTGSVEPINTWPETHLAERRFPVSGMFSIIGLRELTADEFMRFDALYRVDLLVHTPQAWSVHRAVFIKGASDLVTFRRFARVASWHGAILDHPAQRTGKAGRDGRDQWQREVARMVNTFAAGEVVQHG